jgi:hypothetical protein
MKLSYMICILALGIVSAEAGDYLEQPLTAGQIVDVDFRSLVNTFLTILTNRYTPFLDEFDLRLVNYLKSYTSIQRQLSEITKVIPIGRNFSVYYVNVAASKHIESVELDVDTSASQKELRKTIFKPFFDSVEAAEFRFAVIEAAADRNPSYAKCWFNSRKTAIKLYGELFFSHPEIIDKNMKELNDKLECLAKDIDAFVIKTDQDLSRCVIKEKSVCVDRYVS